VDRVGDLHVGGPVSDPHFPFDVRADGTLVPDPHFVLTDAAHAYLAESPMPEDPPFIDVAAIAPRLPRRDIVHRTRRAAFVGASCLLAVCALAFCAGALMICVYLVFHR
jgi:hypothetical protein